MIDHCFIIKKDSKYPSLFEKPLLKKGKRVYKTDQCLKNEIVLANTLAFDRVKSI